MTMVPEPLRFIGPEGTQRASTPCGGNSRMLAHLTASGGACRLELPGTAYEVRKPGADIPSCSTSSEVA